MSVYFLFEMIWLIVKTKFEKKGFFSSALKLVKKNRNRQTIVVCAMKNLAKQSSHIFFLAKKKVSMNILWNLNSTFYRYLCVVIFFPSIICAFV